jgi:hypothetical protein
MPSLMQRRTLLRLLAGSAAALPLASLFGSRARAVPASARRVIFFYTPDGVHEADWGLEGRQLGALGTHRQDVVLLRGLKMDDNGEGHNDGAKLLLKGSLDHPTSFDQFLGATFGAGSYYPHLYLGAQAHAAPPGGDGDDWFISYKNGSYVSPEDNPAVAFGRLFPDGQVPTVADPGVPGEPDPALLRDKSVLDVVLADLHDLEAGLSGDTRRKLALHLEAVRDVERRIATLLGSGDGASPGGVVGNCAAPTLDFGGPLHDAAQFPALLTAQMHVMVMAMACGLTRVGTLQCSRHTSPLSMPFVGSARTMQSHEASHNDGGVFLEQRVWFFQQLATLLSLLAERPDPDVAGATMLDTTLVLSLSEIQWGPSHKHHDMPFVLAGGTGGKLRSGTAFDAAGRHHSHLMASIAQALGTPASGWFHGAHQVIPGLVG